MIGVLYKIKDIADIANISVRTLHHYDKIDLLKPEAISSSGYRLYSDQSLETLQQILFYKEIGCSLQQIKSILESPDFDRKRALLQHKDLLKKKKERLEEMIQTIDQTLLIIEGGGTMNKEEMFEGFDMSEIEHYQKKYAKEAQELYGKKIVDETLKRTTKYSKDEWKSITKTQEAIYQTLIEGMSHGPDDPQVQQAVASWQKYITDNFYDCTLEILRGLGDLYVHDERFTATIDKYKPGLSTFFRSAIIIYCDNHTS